MSRLFATESEVLALSPDAASSKAAKGLQSAHKWPSSGCDEHAVWGECQGSGSKPYQTQVDLSGPTFKCSCPSRKFPCKHGLALLLLRAQGQVTEGVAQPPWVVQWLAQRQEKAQEKAEKQAQKQAQKQEQKQPQADQPGSADKAAAAAQRRVAKRWETTLSGLQELALWMQDMVTQGLATLGSDSQAQQRWGTMGARMIDAQAPGMAARIEQVGALIDSGPQWQHAVLNQLGHWQLLIDAAQHHERLAPDVLADVQAALGWPLDKASVMAQSHAEIDVWRVVGQRLIEREGRLLERHVWLRGQGTGRMAWLLDYTQGGRSFDSAWLAGRCYSCALHFYPSHAPLRAVALEPHLCNDHEARPPSGALVPSAAQSLQALQQHIARNPLRSTQPLWCSQAHLEYAQGQWFALWPPTASEMGMGMGMGTAIAVEAKAEAQGWARVPLAVQDACAWQLLALSGGRPVTLFGAWEQGRWHVLSAWTSPPAPPAVQSVPSLPSLPSLELLWWHETTASTTPVPPLAWTLPLGAALQQSALIGVQRLPLPASLCVVEGAPERYPATVLAMHKALNTPAQHPSEQLLRASAVAAVCERAGWYPGQNLASQLLNAPSAAPQATAPESAAASERSIPTALLPALLPVLRHVVQNGSPTLRAHTLVFLQQQGRDWPVALLPLALDAGRQDTDLRALLLPVLGDRGRWLAQFNPAWRYACGVCSDATEAQIWEEGSLAQRVQWLQAQRSADPAQARARLQAVLGQLPAKERLPLVQVLRVGLTAEDEALLESLLCSDRSKDVRLQAAHLLSCLPHSAHSQRLCAWMRTLLDKSDKSDKSTAWTIQAPEDSDPAWERDGVRLAPESHFKGGPRAWWLQELTALTPVSFWRDTLNLTPTALVRWARHSDWKGPLLAGWLLALQTQQDPDWIAAVQMLPSSALAEQVHRTLHEQLSSAQRESLWLQHLQGHTQGASVVRLLERLFENWPAGHTLSPALSQAVWALLEQELDNQYDPDDHKIHADWFNYRGTDLLVRCACALIPSDLERLIALYQRPISTDYLPPWRERNLVSQLDYVVQLRRTLAKITPNPNLNSNLNLNLNPQGN